MPPRAALDAAYAGRLAALADRCEQLELPEQAAATRGWAIPRDPRRRYVFVPPEADPLQPGDQAPQLVQQWYARFREIRGGQAEALFQRARQSLAADRPALAFQLLHEVLREDPDHEAARQVLGYRRVEQRWRIPEGVVRSRTVRLDNPLFGFPAGRHWVIDSENFSITTDHSERAGLQLAERLEELAAVWRQLFFGFWSSRAALELRFERPSRVTRSTHRYRVVLFRDRQEYIDRLKEFEPRIELSIGYYVEPRETAFFYEEGRADDSVFSHEVTHQLFSETGRRVPQVAAGANAWIVEGVALYMESLRKQAGYFTLGGVDAERLQVARYRRLIDDFYVPLEQLVALNRDALQQHPEVRTLYSQSAGLAAMLLDGLDDEHAGVVVDYLVAVYQGRDGPGTLAFTSGLPYASLDDRYREFLHVTDEDLARLKAWPVASSLALGRTEVTDRGVSQLSGHSRLSWLDLSHTRVTDDGVRQLPFHAPLSQLSLAGTAVTDAAMAAVGRYGNLEMLDLGGTRITDAGLGQLRSLAQLQQLGLAGTRITDAGLAQLSGLKRLTVVDWTGTGVTADGEARLRDALPGLQR